MGCVSRLARASLLASRFVLMCKSAQFAHHPLYEPRHQSPASRVPRRLRRTSARRICSTAAAIDSAVGQYYGSIVAHEIAAKLLAKRGDQRAAAAEEALLRGFLRSIEVGNGIQEEYAVMRSRHLRVTSQALTPPAARLRTTSAC